MPRRRPRAQHRADLGLSMMITLYPDIVGVARRAIPARGWAFLAGRKMIAARAAATARAAGEPPGEDPRAVTGLPVSGGGDARRTPRGQVHMVPPPTPADIGQLTDIGDSGAKDDG